MSGLRFVAVVMVVLHAGSAAAQSAKQLALDGAQLLKDNKVAEACAAFEKSEHLQHELSTLVSLADCREREGKLATAWRLFQRVERESRNADKKFNQTAHARAAKLEDRLSYLTISIAEELQVTGLVITRDNVELPPGEWNKPEPVDYGDHVVVATAPGYAPWYQRVIVGSLERKEIEIKLDKLSGGTLPPPSTTDGQAEQPSEPDVVVRREPSPFTPRRKLALGLGGGAVVVAGVSIVLGVTANNLRDRALETCPPDDCSAAQATQAQDYNDRARTRALITNVGFGVAAGAAVAAAVLWFTGKPDAESSTEIAVRPVVDATGGGFVIGGAF